VTPDAAETILAWSPSAVLGLLPEDEAASLGLQGTIAAFEAADIPYHAHPITDYGTPDPDFETAWPELRAGLLAVLKNEGRVFVHCRAGYGRSGTIAAALLIAGGMPAAAAIDLVRRNRPGAIETPGQESWLNGLNGAP
jgi:protein-tyrosine phosphatase